MKEYREKKDWQGTVVIPIELVYRCKLSKYNPGYISGPPEFCYPPEGGNLEDAEIVGIMLPDGRIVSTNVNNLESSIFDYFYLDIEKAAIEEAENDFDEPYDPRDPRI